MGFDAFLNFRVRNRDDVPHRVIEALPRFGAFNHIATLFHPTNISALRSLPVAPGSGAYFRGFIVNPLVRSTVDRSGTPHFLQFAIKFFRL